MPFVKMNSMEIKESRRHPTTKELCALCVSVCLASPSLSVMICKLWRIIVLAS